MSLEASVGNVSIVGIEGVTISMEDFAIDLNQAGGTNDGAPNEDVVDYAATDLEVETGAEPITFDFVTELLQAKGSVTLGIYGFFYVAGSFAFEKKSARVTLADTAEPVDVELLTVGLKDVDAFAGVNGPGDNEGAVGLSLVNADFALALMKTKKPDDPAAVQTDNRTWVAVNAYVEEASFIGIEGLELSVSELSVMVNKAGGDNNGAPNQNVVDFTQSDFDLDPANNPDGFMRIETGTDPDDYLDINFNQEYLKHLRSGRLKPLRQD